MAAKAKSHTRAGGVKSKQLPDRDPAIGKEALARAVTGELSGIHCRDTVSRQPVGLAPAAATKRTIDDGTCSQLDRLADSLVVAAMALKYSGEGGAGEGVKAYEADTLYHVLDGIAARLIDMTREAKETA